MTTNQLDDTNSGLSEIGETGDCDNSRTITGNTVNEQQQCAMTTNEVQCHAVMEKLCTVIFSRLLMKNMDRDGQQ